MKENPQISFDYHAAQEMTDSFAITSSVHCRLHGSEGDLLYEQGSMCGVTAFCRKLAEHIGEAIPCGQIHRHGAVESDRFGGRYIYFCPFGMAYFSSPIVTGGTFSGALVSGPVLIMDEEEILDGYDLSTEECAQLTDLLRPIPHMEPVRLDYLSRQLFASAVYISDSTHDLFLARHDHDQQNTIGTYIQQFKSDRLARLYPIETEYRMMDAISTGDRTAAEPLLNELLGYLIFSATDSETLHSRFTELLVVLQRAAIYSGANAEQVFKISHRGLCQLPRLSRHEDMVRILSDTLDQVMELVCGLVDAKSKNVIYKAVDYMRRNCAQKLTLAQVAEYVNYSTCYFSRLFREELGCTFQEQLKQLRIEKSKTLLLSTNASIAEISGMVGFENQSYFCRVFREFTSVTPNQYRKRKRRIDAALERT